MLPKTSLFVSIESNKKKLNKVKILRPLQISKDIRRPKFKNQATLLQDQQVNRMSKANFHIQALAITQNS